MKVLILLCPYPGHTSVDDFAAFYIVGSKAAVMWRDKDGTLNQEGFIFGSDYPLENYILWRTKE